MKAQPNRFLLYVAELEDNLTALSDHYAYRTVKMEDRHYKTYLRGVNVGVMCLRDLNTESVDDIAIIGSDDPYAALAKRNEEYDFLTCPGIIRRKVITHTEGSLSKLREFQTYITDSIRSADPIQYNALSDIARSSKLDQKIESLLTDMGF